MDETTRPSQRERGERGHSGHRFASGALLAVLGLAGATMFWACSGEDEGASPPGETPDASSDDARDPSADVNESKDTGPGGPAPPGDPTVDYRSGTRLRARIFAGGGRRIFRWFEDVVIGDRCEPMPAEDGKVRCMPGSYDSRLDGAFTDPGCKKEAVVLARAGCEGAPRRYLLRESAPPVASYISVPLTLLPETTPLFRRNVNNPDVCELVARTLEPKQEIYEVGAPLPPSTFVALEHDVVEGSGRLKYVGIRGEDGSFSVSRYFDSTLPKPGSCQFQPDVAGTLRCFPTGFTTGLQYGDPSCSQSVALLFDQVPPPDAIALAMHFQSNGCGLTVSAHTVGARYEGSLWAKSEGSCVPAGTTAPWNYYRTAPTDSTRYAAPTMTRVGEGRLSRDAASIDDGTLTFNTPLFDTELSVSCIPGRAADGAWACLPTRGSANAATPLYADALCTKAFVYASSVCEPDTYLTEYVLPSCTGGPRVFKLGAPEAGPAEVYSKSDAGVCTKAAGPQGSGPVRPLSEVAPASLVKLSDYLE